jgi:hypothetical protein
VSATVEREPVQIPGLYLVSASWQHIGTYWTSSGPIAVYLKPVAAIPMELVQSNREGEA